MMVCPQFHWRKRWFWSFSSVQQNMSNQISRYTSPQKNDRWFPYLFPWTMGELGKKSGCEILRSRVRPWWRSWLPSSMRSAERWLGGDTVTRLMNLKLWWDSLDSGTAYIYILYIYIDLCVCVFVECSAYVKRSLCFRSKFPNGNTSICIQICLEQLSQNWLWESVGHPWKLKPIKSLNPHFFRPKKEWCFTTRSQSILDIN